jgi:hypothetical protein
MEPSVWGYNWDTLSLGDINTETWPSRLGDGRKTDHHCSVKKNIVAKSKNVKTGCKFTESSK